MQKEETVVKSPSLFLNNGEEKRGVLVLLPEVAEWFEKIVNSIESTQKQHTLGAMFLSKKGKNTQYLYAGKSRIGVITNPHGELAADLLASKITFTVPTPAEINPDDMSIYS